MRKICLDKTYNLTRAIMNKGIQVPDFVKVEKTFGAMDRFRFVNSKVEIPIEHIGLALLSYQSAVEQFMVTKINEDMQTGEKSLTQSFESLMGTGVYISDFLQSISPDAMNWYCGSDGLYSFKYLNNNVLFTNPSDLTQCKAFNEEGQDVRELTVREAYLQAVKGYVAESLDTEENPEDTSFAESIHKFIEDDGINFDNGMEQLNIDSTKLVVKQVPLLESQENFVDVGSVELVVE